MSSIAVTGSTGFVGRYLLRNAADRGLSTTVVDRDALLHPPAMIPVLRTVGAVVHLAARAHMLVDPAHDRETEFHFANVELTHNLAVACRSAGVRRLVFVSSAGVLGNTSPAGQFTDASPPTPHDAYTRSKLAAEEMLLEHFADDLEICIVRPPLVYGPGAPGNFARLFKAVRSGLPLPVGALHAPRSMVSVRNLCDLLLVLAGSAGVRGERMLVSDEQSATVPELVRMMARALGRRPRVVTVPLPLLSAVLRLIGREADLTRLAQPFELNPSRALEVLGWRPPYRLQDEIAWTAAAIGSEARWS